jgi:hypothetical protein
VRVFISTFSFHAVFEWVDKSDQQFFRFREFLQQSPFSGDYRTEAIDKSRLVG